MREFIKDISTRENIIALGRFTLVFLLLCSLTYILKAAI